MKENLNRVILDRVESGDVIVEVLLFSTGRSKAEENDN
eukprot:CAMPEP_0170531828 /NCGR_PEP_ID=MMETSP0209-20121228/65470_1 /TAXON_ID=665100 ORGANISM="Litonotus pictus, Strain P1" /NCGR_SAMPLE_ID=MMETSP0209 /ASSEMBLY_ACC=CAM_ASM_000301 /LENGTH=37 /DNA_ID= /DNA_START= /DNA_END= /DNA_ORIENTATION=